MQIYISIFLKYFNNYNTYIEVYIIDFNDFICIKINVLSNFISNIYTCNYFTFFQYIFSIYFIFSKFAIF